MEGEGGNGDNDWQAPHTENQPKKPGLIRRLFGGSGAPRGGEHDGVIAPPSDDEADAERYITQLFKTQLSSPDNRLELAELEKRLKVWERTMPDKPLPPRLQALRRELRTRGRSY